MLISVRRDWMGWITPFWLRYSALEKEFKLWMSTKKGCPKLDTSWGVADREQQGGLAGQRPTPRTIRERMGNCFRNLSFYQTEKLKIIIRSCREQQGGLARWRPTPRTIQERPDEHSASNIGQKGLEIFSCYQTSIYEKI